MSCRAEMMGIACFWMAVGVTSPSPTKAVLISAEKILRLTQSSHDPMGSGTTSPSISTGKSLTASISAWFWRRLSARIDKSSDSWAALVSAIVLVFSLGGGVGERLRGGERRLGERRNQDRPPLPPEREREELDERDRDDDRDLDDDRERERDGERRLSAFFAPCFGLRDLRGEHLRGERRRRSSEMLRRLWRSPERDRDRERL